MSNYAISDLHGEFLLYDKVCKFLKPEDKVYFLGDATDRGGRSFRTMQAILSNPQWIYLCGNHEDMLADAIYEYYEGDSTECYMELVSNGGLSTFDSWMQNGASFEWYNIIKKLPTYETYYNNNGILILLSHAGFTPEWKDGHILIPSSRSQLLWDRKHLDDNNWDEEHLGNVACVHGHTPQSYQIPEEQEWEQGAHWYCNNHKINIDCGAHWTKYTVLLDLDTFDEYVVPI
jgi:calcineurin-like phosphoesterase family protein